MLNSILPMAIFIVLTLVYLGIIYINGESLTLTVVYYCILMTVQIFFTYLASSDLCGSPQINSVFIWGLIPWIFIYLTINLLLVFFPGWKSPFSNTFGYMIVNLLGVSDTLNEILKSNFSSKDSGLNKIAEKIYEDQSILINEFTPENFEISINKLKPLLDTSKKGYTEALKKFKQLVKLKDEISRGIWYILTGVLTISVSNMGIASTKCKKTPDQIKKEVDSYHEKMGDLHKQDKENDKKAQIYKIRD